MVVPIPMVDVVAETPWNGWVKASYDPSLLLKVVQSAPERHPKVEPFAVSQVTFPFEYVSPVPKVVVAVQVGTPPTRARTCPFVPADVVASCPVPLPRSMELAWILLHPVPP